MSYAACWWMEYSCKTLNTIIELSKFIVQEKSVSSIIVLIKSNYG